VTLSDTNSFAALPGARVSEALAASARMCAEPFSFADTPALTTALRAGNEAAFRWLHSQWNLRLHRYCFAIAGGDDALAGEIAQATYLRAARHLRVLADEAALWAWLARAARDAATDLRRVGGRYLGALARFAAWFRPAPPKADDGLLSALDGALEQLDPEERALVEARYFRREPLEETGARLGCSARAIEGRLARLREKLRRLIAERLQAS
jgi:RNA polymerase sigma-70 factor (ECF subfamily)